jgi:crotonobetainyl-CoA:carnitine CoA-transferase CaiB-like acyl-CoA transferase
MMHGPLDGYRIVDATTMLSGPWATMILADQGADVIKIEPPGRGDHVRHLGNRRGGMSAMFLNINRNKRSVAIDLKTAGGVALLKRIAATADVFVQNFRPGVVERLAIAEDDIRNAAPEIIYVSISGFGEKGPWAAKPAYDPIIQALSGLTTVQAGSDRERPRLIRTVLADKLSAVIAAQAITAALVARERTGKGQHVRVSMLDAMLYFLWASDMSAQTYPDFRPESAPTASFIDLIYETKDGHMTVAVMSNKEWAGLTRALERPEWLNDPRFETPVARDKNVDERLSMTQEVLRTRATAEWMERLEAEDVPCAPALTRDAAIRHPQVAASQGIVEVEHPTAGRLRQARAAARFDKTPTANRLGAPRLGEHTWEVLAEAGLTRSEITELQSRGVIGVQAPTPVETAGTSALSRPRPAGRLDDAEE